MEGEPNYEGWDYAETELTRFVRQVEQRLAELRKNPEAPVDFLDRLQHLAGKAAPLGVGHQLP